MDQNISAPTATVAGIAAPAGPLRTEPAEDSFAICEEARKLFRVSRRKEASALLIKNFRKQFVKVRNFLRHELEIAK